ncbi:MAG: hypothetical protein D6744_10820 [Planctomycetota bacterium]|nr:MAG: hypothetical protein D6744_10820 [Planctomycetota bacterium]
MMTSKATKSAPPHADIVRTTLTIDQLLVAPGAPVCAARCGDALYMVRAKALAASSEPGAERVLDFADQDACRLVATGVEERVTLNRAAGVLTYVKDNQALALSLTDGGPARRLPLPCSDESVASAVLSDDLKNALVVLRDDSQFDFCRFTPALVDLESREARRFDEAASVLELRAYWSPAADTFLVFDPDRERVFRVKRGARAAEPADTPAAPGRIFTALVTHPTQPWVSLLVSDSNTNRPYLMQGAINSHVQWEGSTRFEEGIPACVSWHPTDRTIVCARSIRKQTIVETVTPVGMVTARVELPRGWECIDLKWSASGEYVLVVGQVGVMVWHAAAAAADLKAARRAAKLQKREAQEAPTANSEG